MLSRTKWIAVALAGLIIIAGAVEIGRGLLNRAPTHAAGAVANAPPTSPAVDALGCTLPVFLSPMTIDYLSNFPVGFVNTATGAYSIDGSASSSVSGMPTDYSNFSTGRPPQALSYSGAARHWLPVSSDRISPDGLSYLYIDRRYPPGPGPYGTFAPQTAFYELMRYDIASRQSTEVWAGVTMGWVKWTAGGLIVVAEDLAGGHRWLVDPLLGSATELQPSVVTPLRSDPQATDLLRYRAIGFTDQGNTIWWLAGINKPGAPDWVFYETAPGQRVYIYKGKQSDARGFDPDEAYSDAGGIWFSDYQLGRDIWRWDPRHGLRKIPIAFEANVWYQAQPAGRCF